MLIIVVSTSANDPVRVNLSSAIRVTGARLRVTSVPSWRHSVNMTGRYKTSIVLSVNEVIQVQPIQYSNRSTDPTDQTEPTEPTTPTIPNIPL